MSEFVGTGETMRIGQTVLVRTAKGLFAKAKIVNLPGVQHPTNYATIQWFMSKKEEDVKIRDICDSTILAVRDLMKARRYLDENIEDLIAMGDLPKENGRPASFVRVY